MEKKKQKMFFLIGIIFLVLLAIFLLIYFLVIKKSSTNGTTAAPKANGPVIESRVTILQNDVNIFDFSTEEEHQVRDLVHLRIWPILSFYTTEEMKSVKIKNIHVETANNYDVAVYTPGHIANNLTEYDFLYGTREEIRASDIKDQGSTLEFNVVDTAQYYDEVYKTSGIPQWFIYIKNLGEYNYTEILNNQNTFDSSKNLEYANVTGGDLNTSFYFDLEIVFEDGEKYLKRFTSVIEGDKYMADQFYNPKLTY